MFRPVYALIVISALMCAMPALGNELIRTGNCTLSQDPQFSAPPLLNFCINASAGSWIAQKSKVPNSNQPPVLHRADGKISLLITPWVGLHASGHSSVFIDRQSNETSNKENQKDSLNLQIGNSALSRHRINIGQGRPVYRLDHNMRPNLEYIWGLDRFLAPVSEYGTYTYDNQLDWTIQATFGHLSETDLRDSQRMFGSARAMYDIAALEGTRISLGGYGDGLIRRAVALGILNINGKGDETAIEITRTFSFNPYKPSEFQQLIRLSYVSHVQDKFRYKFQYDDFFKFIRLGGFGVRYEPQKYTHFESVIGYAKREDAPKQSHWFAALNAGAHLE